MNKPILACILLISNIAWTQETINLHSIETRAVIIGISDYQDSLINDLHFAHQDARAFNKFLQSKSGGQVSDQNLRLLTDESATLAEIQAALSWLLHETRAGDQAIIYFAGHGDVESKNKQEKGYLLAYDTPRNNYNLNALDIDFLNEKILDGLAARDAKVIVILDACHSGALAGEARGKEATASELMKRFASEIKIMSCQPYELSQEGEDIGGGRGVFSYYLEQGLAAAADQDKNQEVDLFELEEYLQDNVRAKTNKMQHPDIFGGKKQETLFVVDDSLVAAVRLREKARVQVDFENKVLELMASQKGRNYYKKFLHCLESGELTTPEDKCAAKYRDQLKNDTTFKLLWNIIDEKLTTTLLNDVQQALNAYLDTDPNELAQRDKVDQKYSRFVDYLAKAAEVFGPKDPRYRQTLAKQFYFEGLVFRLQGEQRGGIDSLYQVALASQDSAYALEDHAPYICNEIGLLHLRLGNPEKAVEFLEKAATFAPKWAIAHNNLAIGYKALDSLKLSETHCRLAIKLKPGFASAYTNLAILFDALGLPDSAEIMHHKAIALSPADKDNYYNLAVLLSQQANRQADAERVYHQALQIDPEYPEAWLGLGILYIGQALNDSAEQLLLKAISLKPDYMEAYQYLVFLHQNQWDTVTNLLQKSRLDTLQKKQVLWSVSYFPNFNQGERALQLAISLDPSHPAGYYQLCTFYAANGREKEAVDNLEKTLKKAGTAVGDMRDYINADPDLDSLRQTPRFKKLMKRYFPD